MKAFLQAFSRGGVLTPEVLTACLLFMVSSGNDRGIRQILLDFWEQAAEFGLGLPTDNPVSASAVCQAGERLNADVFRDLLYALSNKVRDEVGPLGNQPLDGDSEWKDLEVRLTRVESPSGPAFYIRSLDREQVSVADIAELYHMRWKIEDPNEFASQRGAVLTLARFLTRILLEPDPERARAVVGGAIERVLLTRDRHCPPACRPQPPVTHTQIPVALFDFPGPRTWEGEEPDAQRPFQAG